MGCGGSAGVAAHGEHPRVQRVGGGALRARPAAPTTTAMRENTPRHRRIALPSYDRLKKLPHRPRSAIGTTGTGVSCSIRSIPGRNAFISPVDGQRAFGKDADDLAVAQRRRGRRRTPLPSAPASSRADAIGIALHRAEEPVHAPGCGRSGDP